MQSPQRTEDEIQTEATDWFIRLLQNESDDVHAQCQNWRAADPANDAAFHKAEAAWSAAILPGEKLAFLEKAELEVHLRAMERRKRSMRNTRRLGTLALVLFAVLGAGIWLLRPNVLEDLNADFVTARGERRTVILADGTSVLMDADSAIAIAFFSDERKVTLIRGVASFDVAHASTPFRVVGGGGVVTALGTRFDVRLSGGEGVVILERGKVSVDRQNTSEPVFLSPGEQVHYNASAISKVEPVDLETALAWQHGRFVFYRARLSDVIAEIQRYRPGRIIVASDSLASQLVTGSFMLDNAEASLASLQASVGFQSFSLGPYLTLIRP